MTFFFAHTIRAVAALGFKILSDVALYVKSLHTPGLMCVYIECEFYQICYRTKFHAIFT